MLLQYSGQNAMQIGETQTAAVCAFMGILTPTYLTSLGLLLEISLYVQILSSFVPNYRATIIASILSWSCICSIKYVAVVMLDIPLYRSTCVLM